jgi:hypothetical protein
MFLRQKPIRTAANDFTDRLVRRFRRQTLRHDRGHSTPGSGQGFREMGKGPLQPEPNGAVVGC